MGWEKSTILCWQKFEHGLADYIDTKYSNMVIIAKEVEPYYLVDAVKISELFIDNPLHIQL
jgi:hypothetical protein